MLLYLMLMSYDASLFFNNMRGESAPKPYLVNYYAAVLSNKLYKHNFILYIPVDLIGGLSRKTIQTRFYNIYQ